MNADFWLVPWQSTTSLWLMAAAAFTAIACGLPGTFLVLRRMSLTGDAISHSVLPGIVIGFLFAGSLDSPWLIAGAAASGWLTVMGIEWLHRRGGVREDAATGVAFSAMFSLGVVLLRLFASRVDLDPDCVLFGNLETAVHGQRFAIGAMTVPGIVVSTGIAALFAALFVASLYHRLLSGSFDPALARLTRQSPSATQSLLLAATSAMVVVAFQSVGAVMSVALLVLPAAAMLMTVKKLPYLLLGVVAHGMVSAIGGFYLAMAADCNYGAAVVLAGTVVFCLCWTASRFGPRGRHA